MNVNYLNLRTFVTSIILVLSTFIFVNNGYSQVDCKDSHNIFATFPLPDKAKNIKGMYDKGFYFLNFTINKESFLSWLKKCYFVRHNLSNRLEIIKEPLSVSHLDEIERKSKIRKSERIISNGYHIILTAETYAFSIIFDNKANRTYIEIFNPLLSSLGCYYRIDYFFIPKNAKNIEIKKQNHLTYIIFNLGEIPFKSWLQETGFIFDTQVIRHSTTIETLIRNKNNNIVKGKSTLNKGHEIYWNYDQNDKGSIYYNSETKIVHVKFSGESWGEPFRKECLEQRAEHHK